MKNLQDKLANINKAKVNTPSVSKPIIQEVVVKKRIGRPTFKSEEIEYSRIFADIPTELKDRMTVALIQKYKGQFSTMSELVNAAIAAYLDKWCGRLKRVERGSVLDIKIREILKISLIQLLKVLGNML